MKLIILLTIALSVNYICLTKKQEKVEVTKKVQIVKQVVQAKMTISVR